jgi:hypothetical protein
VIRLVGCLGLGLVISSCGLESYDRQELPVVTSYLSQQDFTFLQLVHDPDRFVGTNFLGYEVFYKIYPDLSSDLSNLTRDSGLSKENPTKDYLLSIGYQKLNGKSSVLSQEPLILIDAVGSNQTTVNLNFSNFLQSQRLQGAVVEPVIEVVSTSQSDTLAIFRTTSKASEASTFSSFSSLTTTIASGELPGDMANTITKTTTSVEIDIFIVSYYFSPSTLAGSFSAPVAWGIIRPVVIQP